MRAHTCIWLSQHSPTHPINRPGTQPSATKMVTDQPSSVIISHHQPHQPSSVIISHHQSSSVIISHHQSSVIISHHQSTPPPPSPHFNAGITVVGTQFVGALVLQLNADSMLLGQVLNRVGSFFDTSILTATSSDVNLTQHPGFPVLPPTWCVPPSAGRKPLGPAYFSVSTPPALATTLLNVSTKLGGIATSVAAAFTVLPVMVRPRFCRLHHPTLYLRFYQCAQLLM